jgi:hypothetical protein
MRDEVIRRTVALFALAVKSRGERIEAALWEKVDATVR